MSKKKNYNKMYVSGEEAIVPQEEVVETVEIENETAEVIEAVSEEKPVVKKSKKVKGTVVNCSKLNVREQMNTKAAVLCVLPASTEVKVIADEKHNDWYHVFTMTGIEGYCMKNYISINS